MRVFVTLFLTITQLPGESPDNCLSCVSLLLSKQRSLLWGNVTAIDTFPGSFGFQHTFKEMGFYILKLYHREMAGRSRGGRFLCQGLPSEVRELL